MATNSAMEASAYNDNGISKVFTFCFSYSKQITDYTSVRLVVIMHVIQKLGVIVMANTRIHI